jgi:antitoxin component YwqK of YwqJK toxin-antitoxin module
MFAVFTGLLMFGCKESDLDDPKILEKILSEALHVAQYKQYKQQPYTGWLKEMWNAEQVRELCYVKDGKLNGLMVEWYENGKKKKQTNYKNHKKHGLNTEWYECGQKKVESNEKEGELDGLLTTWYKNGQKEIETKWKDGKRNGSWSSWYENGQKRDESIWKDSKLISANCWLSNGERCPVTDIKNGKGVLVNYNEDGTEESRIIYKDGKPVRD